MKHTCCDNNYAELPGECQACVQEEHADMEAFNDMEVTCEHGINEDDCLDCGAKHDAMAEQAQYQREWNHFHHD